MTNAAALGLGLTMFMVCSSLAATHHVPSQYGTIQAGVDAAAAGDTVLVAPGYYTDQSDRVNGGGFLETACVHLKGDLTLLSEAGPDQTVVELTAPGAGFPKVMDGRRLSGPVAIEGFTVVSTVSGVTGLDVRDSPGLVLRNCVVRDLGVGNGSGVSIIRTDAEVYDCVFRDLNIGAAAALGGSEASRVVQDCRFENILGSAIGFTRQQVTAVLTAEITNCTFINVRPGTGSAPVGIGNFDDVSVVGCRFRDCVSDLCGGLNIGGGASFLVADNVFANNHVPLNGRGGAGRLDALSGGIVSGNTVVGCTQEFPALGGAAFDLDGTLQFSQNVIVDCSGAEAVGIHAGSAVTTSCNVFWNNPQGNAYGFTLDSTDVDADPRFCDPLLGDYTVDDLSPCLPANSGGCGRIGAFGLGCGDVSIESRSWGEVKAAYRE